MDSKKIPTGSANARDQPANPLPPPPQYPRVYEDGYERVRTVNAALADEYVRHTTVSDLAADAVMDELASLTIGDVNLLINDLMHQDKSAQRNAPAVVRDFFRQLEEVPQWFDPAALTTGCRAFHSNPNLFLQAFVVATLRNASTLIAKSFYASGRVMGRFGLRRIRQNTRHLIEIMLPGALERQGDGWKLSVRIRLVHARLRRLIRDESDWDESVHGVPLSTAHISLAAANFSATTLRYAELLGVKLAAEYRDGYMQVWRHASWLIGVPEHLLFEGDYRRTAEFAKVGHLCEPPPDDESRAIAQALVEAMPLIAKKEGDAHDAFVRQVSRCARALLGREFADGLGIPRLWTFGLLPSAHAVHRSGALVRRLSPALAAKLRGANFAFLLEASMLDDLGYRLPNHLDTDRSVPW